MYFTLQNNAIFGIGHDQLQKHHWGYFIVFTCNWETCWSILPSNCTSWKTSHVFKVFCKSTGSAKNGVHVLLLLDFSKSINRIENSQHCLMQGMSGAWSVSKVYKVLTILWYILKILMLTFVSHAPKET